MPAPVLQCPSCKEYISSDAQSCRFCHVPLDERTRQQAAAATARENRTYRRHHYQKHLLIGSGMALLGLVITLGTYTLASYSREVSHYIIMHGLIATGVLDFLYGLFGWFGEVRSKD